MFGAPAANTVAIAKCATYSDVEVASNLKTMFDQLGGLSKLVNNKTVTVKLNLTGSPGQRFEGRPLGVTHYTHPVVIAAAAHLMGEAGAKRIRFVESAWALSGPPPAASNTLPSFRAVALKKCIGAIAPAGEKIFRNGL